jgi:hypothetical protein
MRKRLLSVGTAAALILSVTLVACDSEDVRNVKEGVTDVKQGVEKRAKDIEKQIDRADTDGQDD